jgi:hypothetical protein
VFAGSPTIVLACALAAALVGAGCRQRPAPGRPDDATATVVPAGRPPAPAASAGRLPAPAAAGPIRLADVTDQTGITFRHTDGSSGRRYMVEPMSTGLATFDYDRDGMIDIYFPNGAPLPGARFDAPPHHCLYKNLGGWRFKDVTEEAGVACRGYGMGITVGDYDNDGWPDLYLNNYGPNVLYRNNGDGTFSDATARAGVGRGNLVGAGACFLDIDGDGLADLYVGNYIQLDLGRRIERIIDGYPSYPAPPDYAPVPDNLYRNRGDGTFEDVSVRAGIAAHAGRSMGMIAADYDNDGATDIFVLNDVQENFLFHNDGTGKFEEVGLTAGVAFNAQGEHMGNMGVDCADLDHNGRLDFLTTNYQHQVPVLFRNLGHGMFEDAGASAPALAGTYQYVKWGCGLVDFDNDGRKDLFIVNGHTEDNIELRDRTTCYRCPNVLFWNAGQGKFVDVSAAAGSGLQPVHAGRGVAFDDLDNDGDVDVVVLNSREPPTVLRNLYYENGGTNRWLQIELSGVKTNRGGVGAHVTVTAGDLVQLDEVHGGRGYQSHWGSRLYFGLGPHDRADRIEVRWIGGGVDVLEDVPANQRLAIVEGASKQSPAQRRAASFRSTGLSSPDKTGSGSERGHSWSAGSESREGPVPVLPGLLKQRKRVKT